MDIPLPTRPPLQKRILLIEDDTANRILFSEYLTHCNYQVLALASGVALHQHLEAFQPHLLLLDLGLPDIDGYEIIEQIKADKVWSSLPIIVVSGYAFAADYKRAIALGVSHYLVKPVRLKELAQTIHISIRKDSWG